MPLLFLTDQSCDIMAAMSQVHGFAFFLPRLDKAAHPAEMGSGPLMQHGNDPLA